MRISATGEVICPPRHLPGRGTARRAVEGQWRGPRFPLHQPSAGPPPREIAGRKDGFTLVELLVVITLIGILAAAVMLAMPDPRGSLAAEAERFAARAKAAQDRAIIDARPIALELDQTGYGFTEREKAEWRPIEAKPFAHQDWGETTQPLLEQGPTRIVFDPTGLTEPTEIVLARDEQRVSVRIGHDGKIEILR